MTSSQRLRNVEGRIQMRKCIPLLHTISPVVFHRGESVWHFAKSAEADFTQMYRRGTESALIFLPKILPVAAENKELEKLLYAFCFGQTPGSPVLPDQSSMHVLKRASSEYISVRLSATASAFFKNSQPDMCSDTAQFLQRNHDVDLLQHFRRRHDKDLL